MRPSAFPLALSLVGCLVGPSVAQNAREQILAGVRSLAWPGAPGRLCVFGDSAEVLLTDDIGAGIHIPYAATATPRKGRVVAFGHLAFLDAPEVRIGDTRRLMSNAIAWLTRGARRPRIVTNDSAAFLAELAGDKWQIETDVREPWRSKANLVVLHDPVYLDREQAAAVVRYVEDGGALLTASLGWGWRVGNRDKTIRHEHPANWFLPAFGIAIGNQGFLRSATEIEVPPQPSTLVHAGECLQRVLSGESTAAESRRIGSVLESAMWALPITEPTLMQPLVRYLETAVAPSSPTLQAVANDDPWARMRLLYDGRRDAGGGASRLADEFPGRCTAPAKPTSQRVTVAAGEVGWQSTGLYAPAGAVVDLAGPTRRHPDWVLRVGAHSDLGPTAVWPRPPEVSGQRRFDMLRRGLSTAFGGLVYIDVRDSPADRAVKWQIKGVVPAPMFLDGMDAEDWRTTLATTVAPWGELVGEHVVLTLPRSMLEPIADPRPLLDFWEQVHASVTKFYGNPARSRRQRIVADLALERQIADHSGPVTLGPRAVAAAIDLAGLRERGSWPEIALLAEKIGRADVQDSGLDGLEDLATVFVLEQVLGFGRKNVQKLLEDELGRSDEDGRRRLPRRDGHPYVEVWLKVQQRFGWQPFHSMFAAIAAGDGDLGGKVPGQDRWPVRLSLACKSDLSPFYKRYGWKLSEQAFGLVDGLPRWSGDEPDTGR
ncbi:MAG: M60 family metallopeptidase [Planctomycetes bacterium]|nr:M60 family metallopeptidase [Planctomycetota bacterium]